MSKNLLVVAFAALSIAAASSAGATSNGSHSAQLSLVREVGSQPLASDLRLNENGVLLGFDAQSADSADSHIVKAGLWSSVKSAAKKVGSGVKTVAKAIGTGAKRAGSGVVDGVKDAARGIAKSPIGQSFGTIGKSVGKTAGKVYTTVKDFLKKKK